MSTRDNKNPVIIARALRKKMTKAELIIWSALRNRKLNGFKFRRQQPVFYYIVDFYCHELRLIIEVDGEIHNAPEQRLSDSKRDKSLKENGYIVLRITNEDVENNYKETISRIKLLVNQISLIQNGPKQ